VRIRKGTSDKVRPVVAHRDRTKYARRDYKAPVSGEDYCPFCGVLLVYAGERSTGVCEGCTHEE
jgi:hypothetical protein